MEDEYEQPPDFCRSDLLEAMSLVLTCMKAALFTAIVTAFALDAMSDLDKMSESNQPSSILTVNSLWFMSIISSLAAAIWAILCLEWFASFTEGYQAEDYEEIVEKTQRRFEAMVRWRVRLVMAAIPLFLHISLFLFLAGLWLRLRDINKQLGLIVGVLSLILASSYVAVTLLPTFTDVPFSTSASELIGPVVNGIRHIFRLRRFIRPPLVFVWIANRFPVGSPFRTPILPPLLSYIPRLRPRQFSALVTDVFKMVALYARATWRVFALLPIIPTFVFDRNPFDELNKLQVGSQQDKRIHTRALFRLMNTPLSRDEVKEILTEFKNRGGSVGEPLDRSVIRLLVLALSYILDRNDISEDERPIFDYCTIALTEEMDRAFENGEHDRRILLRNHAVFKKLLPYLHPTPPGEEASHSHPMTNQERYWSGAIPALWLCPTENTIRNAVIQLDSTVRSVDTPLLQRIVRGLHTAVLIFPRPGPPAPGIIPDFSVWDWEYRSSNKDLDKTLLSFLQDIFAAFVNTYPRIGLSTTSSLAIDCLQVLDNQPERYPLEFQTALCFFIVLMWRSDPQAPEAGPPLARALLASAESYQMYNNAELYYPKVLTTRLRAIAYGPKPLISRQSCSLTCLEGLRAGLPEPITVGGQCLMAFIDAHAAILEATLAVDGHFEIFDWMRSPDCVTTRNLFTSSFLANDFVFNSVRRDPKYRLPYLYSLVIALAYTTEGRSQELWKVGELFVTRGEQEGITIDRALDTNILVVAILKFSILNQPEAIGHGRKENLIGVLQEIAMYGIDWRTRWKSVYLTAGIASLLSQMDRQQEAPQFLIESANETFEQVKHESVPSDWGRTKKGLRLCRLESKVRSLVGTRGEMDEAVYEWSGRENVPYLSLYIPRQTAPEPISRVAYWAVRKFQLQR